ncbi:hypothetical protein [Bradyrhizobium lablabi]|uniref:hypothetical protein n=1 Tax=Bradyrhizobium lablabi TaxID=722472 RepID=UPI00115F8C10|nr:hypothetical protein [Bradyrhizobium lablabi]
MSRWWRAYDEAVDDPKLCLLSDKQHRAWFNLCCIASQNDGRLPPIAAVAFKLRMPVARAKSLVAELVALRLIDMDPAGTCQPHNWNERQYKTDITDPTTAKRSKNYRDRKRDAHRDGDRDAAVTVTVTRAETEAETENSDAGASGGEPPIDHRKRLFNEGLQKLAAMTGKGPDACRSFVGKCLKAAEDNAVTVLGLIEDAERNQTVDPTAWIAARLKPRENSNGRRTVHDAARELTEHLVQALDEPAPSGLRGPAGGGSLRLLPPR